jgi:predicted dithiol-disulfide oxidoreductase (DUF899 family)
MPDHRVVNREEWRAEWEEQIAEEKELTRRGDELTKKRQEMPWVKVETPYSFETEDGTKGLADLFDGRSQLMIYHFMFGPSYETGCPVCSSIADTLAPQAPHLAARDTTLILSSRAPQEKLQSFRARMGWDLPWVTAETRFHQDLGRYSTEEELKPFLESGNIPATVIQNAEMCGTDAAGYVAEGPGLSVFTLDGGDVYGTYMTTARGLEAPGMSYYQLLDRTPKGRNESPDEPLWIRYHDSY